MAELAEVANVVHQVGETATSAFEEFNFCGFVKRSTLVPVVLSLLLSILEFAIDFWTFFDFEKTSDIEERSVISLSHVWIVCLIFDLFLCISKITLCIYMIHIYRQLKKSIGPTGKSSDLDVGLGTIQIWSIFNSVWGFLVEDVGINFVKAMIAFQSPQATEDLQTTSAKVSSVVAVVAIILQFLIQLYAIYKNSGEINSWARDLQTVLIVVLGFGGLGPIAYSLGISFNVVSVHHDSLEDIKLNTRNIILCSVLLMVVAFLISFVIACRKNCKRTTTNSVCMAV